MTDKAMSGKGLVIVWPWFFGTYLAVEFGAANPSLARTITGWVFEAAWLAFLAFTSFYLLAKRSAARKLALALAAEQELIAEATERAAEQARIAAKARAEAAERAAEQGPGD